MDLREAAKTVAADVRESYPELSDREAVQYARETVTVESLDNSEGGHYDEWLRVLTAPGGDVDSVNL
ncbi:hypothetical protein DN069_20435 [Streptacidiphilus pinicola]|uniref:Uncharacterized protein n=1 Tax=Streptacidiphilus pinicola TaxID=2219663 RepID=A0A2X0K8G7_9ACTN|nr:hypothetical protein [Streptacidiphilus pinicola]RAG83809.1 hypothetical protein DN069_20435 [Streptacidiphilus pinicola]